MPESKRNHARRTSSSRELKVQRPLVFHVMNLIGRPLEKLGLKRIPFSANELEEAAQRRTGLSNFGGSSYRPGLEKYVESLHRDKSFHFVGKLITSESIITRLSARLRTVQTLKDHPEMASGNLKNPILVIGTPRSGTTFLFNLLALDPALRAPAFWEVTDPAPPASIADPQSVAKRIAAINKNDVAAINKLFPNHKQIHHFASAEQKEECFHLFEPTFHSASYGSLYGNAPTYRDWLFSQPHSVMVDAYGYYAKAVNMLMHGHPEKVWLGKSPVHATHLPALGEVCPDAKIIHTHRPARERIPSQCSLLYHYQQLFLDKPASPHAVAAVALDWNERSMKGITEARKGPTGPSTIDVAYEDLTRDPISAVGGIYDSLGRTFSPQHEERIAQWLAERNHWDPKRVGPHKYDASSFGLDPAKLDALEP